MLASEPDDHDELDLRLYLNVLRRRWRTIVATTVALVAIAVGLALQQDERYRATAEVLVKPRSTESILSDDENAALASSQGAERRLNNEVKTLNAGTTRAAVEEAYNGPLDPDSATAGAGTGSSDVVEVSVVAGDPAEAAKLVNTYVDTYIKVSRQQRVDELVTAGAEIQEQIDDLVARIATVRQPLADIEAQLARSPGNESLGSRRDDLTEQLASELTPLENQRALYQQILEDLRVSAGIAGTGGAQVLTEAEAPDDPVSPQPVRDGLVALVLGLVLGAGLAFLRDTLDERIRNLADVERAAPGLPILAAVPEVAGPLDRSYLALRDAPHSPAAEAYRSLRTSIKFAQLDAPTTVVQITSSLSGEGKTTSAANLAAAFAQGGDRVVIVCCDLRLPRIQERFDQPLSPGFTDVLLRSATLPDALRPVGERLFLLPAGTPPPNPSELLSSASAARVIQALAEEFDVVVIDSTPVLPVTDALVVSRFVDATVVVLDTRRTNRKPLGQALRTLEHVGAPVTGLVLNGVSPGSSYGYGFGYGYGYGAPASGPVERPKPAGASAEPPSTGRIS
ncbi:MAG: polysaccharide biosynthesis tyrosine autokinase [Acidimicrobiales bacterium]|nr:polysaccharide biosynthesis tyrosine autokinase [Acidimicrobiales bacterium]